MGNISGPQARAAVIEAAAGDKLRALVHEAKRLAQSSRVPFRDKAERFITISDLIGNAITPHTPCTGGCSHCCHMATAVSGYEAAMIGRYTGRVPVAQHREGIAEPDAQMDLVRRFTGVACPFLVAGRCSIYPVRPMACRIHHSMNDTPDNCRITPGAPPVEVPRINLTAFISLQAFVFLADDYGDIREFFPVE